MSLLIPIAMDSNGVTVTPTCNKDQGPFKCLGCSMDLTLRQGEKNRWHFAHVSVDRTGCSAGGESYIHRAAKLILVQYLHRFTFVQYCRDDKHQTTENYDGCSASDEFRYDDTHTADVAVFLPEDELKAIIEVKVSHSTVGNALESRMYKVGRDNVWEVEGIDVLNSQRRLTVTGEQIRLYSLIKKETCEECNEKNMYNGSRGPSHVDTRKSIQYKKTTPDTDQMDVVEIIDKETLRRNNVLMKKVYNKPGDHCDRSYTWERVDA